ncbi:MAG TPA: amino acid racemase [Bacillales bacterium]|nr:amino acid racemase [Bacillales bacterium]
MRKYFGIIGGLGPKATADFINSIVDRTVAERDQDHPEFLLLHHPAIPDRSSYILDQSNPNPLPYLCRDVKTLSESNVSFIVIPCNSAHYFFDTLQNHASVPIIDMLSEAVDYIKEYFPQDKAVGILGTPGTLRSNLYQDKLRKAGLDPVTPTKEIQDQVNKLIFQQVKQGEPIDHQAYIDVLTSMYALGCDRILLGCTELSLVENEVVHDYPIIDTQVVLAERTILLSGKQVKKLHAFENSELIRNR